MTHQGDRNRASTASTALMEEEEGVPDIQELGEPIGTFAAAGQAMEMAGGIRSTDSRSW